MRGIGNTCLSLFLPECKTDLSRCLLIDFCRYRDNVKLSQLLPLSNA